MYETTAIISGAMKIYYITNLNTYVINSEEDFILHHENFTIPPFMPGSNEKDMKHLYKSMVTGKLHSYTNQWGLQYLGYRFKQNDIYSIIIGPYFSVTPNYYKLIKDYKLTSNEGETLRNVCNQMQVLTFKKVNSFSSILINFEHMMDKDTTPVIINPDKEEVTRKTHYTEDEDAKKISLRYKVEDDIIHAVETGDKEKALNISHTNNVFMGLDERFPNQPLLRVKNLAIVLNTLLRTAAKNKNVPPILIHRISEKFAYKIEETNQLTKLYQLYDRLISDYADLIKNNSLQGYSKEVRKVIEHLIAFFNQALHNEELSGITYTHPSHLSRKFKQETGMTITGYQQMLRINKAKYLLKTEKLPIDEVAWLVGYEDSSYFSRVFKKQTGLTPTQYRERE
ncbi:AraC family transcriptional regulator [Oceanobacillus sp. Castelsardo]|uniref:AraC family transcriptional regulator n=1 Tax=Oceanobacillus sp. Castelsardo TaxID=1851204 RepID=UPI000837C06C|nr:AraC family transcriptional regulator [Oceanobacillus sp. Castelsardo]